MLLRTPNSPATDLDAKAVRRRTGAKDAVCLAALAVTVVGLVSSAGDYQAELTGHPDEPAHFTTGMMVFDYLRTALGSDPMTFADTYYLRYPKVAFGQWPPMFPMIQAIWYSALGPGIPQALMLVGLATTLTACCLAWRLRRSYGTLVSVAVLAIFLALPLVRTYSSMVMADMFVALFSLLAVFSFCDYLDARGTWSAMLFAGWSSAAILAKGNAFAIGLFAVLAPLALGRVQVYRLRSYWLAGTLVFLLVAPYYAITMSMGLGLHGKPSAQQMVAATTRFYERFYVVGNLIEAASPVVFAMAGIGAFSLWKCRSTGGQAGGRTDASAALVWLIAIVLLQTAAPLNFELRYFLPALLSLMILTAHGLDRIRAWCGIWFRPGAVFIPAALAGVAIVTVPGAVPQRVRGYARAASAMPFAAQGLVILVSSDSVGEGALIAERLVRDRNRAGFVLRASKVLADESWSGRLFRLRRSNTDQVRQYLNHVPVHYVVLDDYANRGDQLKPYHQLLREAIAQASGDFRLVGKFSLHKGGQRIEDAILVYENERARGRSAERIEVDMSRTLGRTLSRQPE